MQASNKNSVAQVLFSNRKAVDLEQYLDNNPHLDIIALTDTQGNNVLHQLAYEGHIQLIKVFVRKAILRLKKKEGARFSKDVDQSDIRMWLNQTNHQGFTPLLYAAYSGHLEIIRYLVEEHNVDYTVKTSTGLNPLHLAAQKNTLMPFLYFRNKLNLYQFDNLNSTPLHWAAYTNSQEVTSYILAQTQSINVLNFKDTDGNTALTLAVTYGNTRVVRRLLIKGANRYIRNNEGKSPLDIARESQFRTITKMLDQHFSLVDLVKFYCNIKIEYRPKGRKYTVPILFLISFIVNLGILNIYICFTQDYTLYTQIAFQFLLLCFYISLLCSRPSNDPKPMQSLQQDYNQRTIKKVCFICRNKIPKRGYHCDSCGVCIEQYDHHCTWINNCVGKRNIARFMFFIVMLVVSIGWIGMVSIFATVALLYNDTDKFSTYFTFRYPPTNDLERFCVLGCFLVNQVTAVFFFPVLMLCIVQIKNLLTNKTTFEKMRGPSEESQIIKSQLGKTGKLSLRNCRVMCAESRASFSTNYGGSFSQLITEKYQSQRVDHTEPTEARPS